MENLGEKFKQARAAKRVTIEQAAEETCIQKASLEALENEDYSQFPAEIFLTGFIRNYAIYLGLNPNEMISLYRSRLIQEQPIPVEKLLAVREKVSINGKAVAAGFAAVLVIAAVVFAAVWFVMREPAVGVTETEEAVLPLFDAQFTEQRIKVGDGLRFLVGDGEFALRVSEIGEKTVIAYESGSEKKTGIIEALPGEESQIDFDLDGIPDVKMTVRSFDARLQSALIRFDREVGEAVREDPSDRPAEEPQQSAFINFQPEEQLQPAESRRVEPIIVETSSVANPFSIDIVFRDRCFVRYKLDTEDDFVEGFFRTNQRLRLDGNMRIYLSLSNAGVASVKVNGTDVQLGTLGQVVSREAQWAFNHQRNLYELRIIPRY